MGDRGLSFVMVGSQKGQINDHEAEARGRLAEVAWNGMLKPGTASSSPCWACMTDLLQQADLCISCCTLAYEPSHC